MVVSYTFIAVSIFQHFQEVKKATVAFCSSVEFLLYVQSTLGSDFTQLLHQHIGAQLQVDLGEKTTALLHDLVEYTSQLQLRLDGEATPPIYMILQSVRNVPVPPTYSSAPAGLELATVKPVAGYPGVFGVFGVHGVHGELTRPPFVAHPSTQDITATRGLRHGTKHRRHCAQTMINGCLVGFLGDSHRDVTALGYYISCCSNALYSLDLIS